MLAKAMSFRLTGATLRNSAGLVALLGLALGQNSEAHFQLLYTPEAALNESSAIPLALVFSHPFDNGFTMDMGEPEAFYVVSQRGPESPQVTTDLSEYLEQIVWAGLENEATAYIANPPRRATRSLGDHTYDHPDRQSKNETQDQDYAPVG